MNLKRGNYDFVFDEESFFIRLLLKYMEEGNKIDSQTFFDIENDHYDNKPFVLVKVFSDGHIKDLMAIPLESGKPFMNGWLDINKRKGTFLIFDYINKALKTRKDKVCKKTNNPDILKRIDGAVFVSKSLFVKEGVYHIINIEDETDSSREILEREWSFIKTIMPQILERFADEYYKQIVNSGKQKSGKKFTNWQNLRAFCLSFKVEDDITDSSISE